MEVKRQARRVAQTDSTVLLLGETGTGKELLAQAIHAAASARAARPFVGVNIAAGARHLARSRVLRRRAGRATPVPSARAATASSSSADGGTLFLDEIGDMPIGAAVQAAARAAGAGGRAAGSNQVQRVDVRIIAATSRDLPAMVASGHFRADLYYRPQRAADPPARAARTAARPGGAGRGAGRRHLAPQRPAAQEPVGRALDLLAAQSWPGNIRELRNALEQATLMTSGTPVLDASHFSRRWQQNPMPTAPAQPACGRQPSVEGCGAGHARRQARRGECGNGRPRCRHHTACRRPSQSSRRARIQARFGPPPAANKLAASRLPTAFRARRLYEKSSRELLASPRPGRRSGRRP
jgi:DNA-binding NtrC family response regulator